MVLFERRQASTGKIRLSGGVNSKRVRIFANFINGQSNENLLPNIAAALPVANASHRTGADDSRPPEGAAGNR